MSKNRLLHMSCRIAVLGVMFMGVAVAQDANGPYQLPFTEAYIPPANMLFALSVEFPTANTGAYKTKQFNKSFIYQGYFEPNFCYQYMPYGQGSTVEGVDGEYFYPVRRADANGVCGGSGEWSGRLLNWASMTVLDGFRLTMTGGKRAADTPTETVVRRVWLDARGSDTFSYTPNSDNNDKNNFPDKYLTQDVVQSYTPLTRGKNWYIANLDPERYKNPDRGLKPDVKVGDRFRVVMEGEATPYEPGSCNNKLRDRYFRVMVKVCSTPGLIESFCTQYPSGNYKPEGLIQKYAQKARFGAFSYPLIDWTASIGDDWSGSNVFQAGGVMRSPLKSMGPVLYANGKGWSGTNANSEWDPNTGQLCQSPDDAVSTCVSGGVWGRSGMINYINQFGYRTNANGWHYKSSDPLAELYYEAMRYYASNYSDSAHGMAPAYRSGNGRVDLNTKDQSVTDGFPMIMDNWKDPIIDKCSKNSIVFLGDVNNNCDGRVPGGIFVSSGSPGFDDIKCTDQNTTSGLDIPRGSLNGSIESVNVRSMLGIMGSYEGLNLVDTSGNGDWLNIACPGGADDISGVGRGCWMNTTLNIAGLAYWAHTRDVRPDLSSEQHIDSYFVDVHERPYRAQNGNPPAGKDPTLYWYAAKYGAYDLDVAQRGNGRLNPNTKASADGVGASKVPAWDLDEDGVPDGWFEGSSPENIKKSFGEILLKSSQNSSQITAQIGVETTEWSSQNKLFFPFYKVINGVWFGDLYGKSADVGTNEGFLDANGGLKTYQWSANQQLDKYFSDTLKNNRVQKPGAEKANGAGRQIIAGRSDGQPPVAFRWGSLAASDQQMLSKDGSQTSAALGAARLDYIRGDYRQELRFGGNFRDRPYGRMGAIINSSPDFVGAPEEGYSDSDFPAGGLPFCAR